MAVNKVVYNTEDGEQTLIDLTEDTVTPETLAEGATAHTASGEVIVGKMRAAPIVDAFSEDGMRYDAEVDGVDEPYVGMEITIIPNRVSSIRGPSLSINGGPAYGIRVTTATTDSSFNATRPDFMAAGTPVKLMFIKRTTDDGEEVFLWRVLNSVRVNIEALVSNGEAPVGSIPVANGANEKPIWRTHKEISLVGEATYNESANRYEVTLPGIGNTKTGENGVYKGLEVTIIPDVTNKANAKLAVNSDGTATGTLLFLSTGNGTGGFIAIPAGFLKAGMPVKMKYTGTGWRITDTPYPDATLLNGAVPVKNGGTGRKTLTSGYYLIGNGTGTVTLKSRAEVLSDIGAVSLEVFNALLARVAALEERDGSTVQ